MGSSWFRVSIEKTVPYVKVIQMSLRNSELCYDHCFSISLHTDKGQFQSQPKHWGRAILGTCQFPTARCIETASVQDIALE